MNEDKKFFILDIFCTALSIVATIGLGYLISPLIRRLAPAQMGVFKKCSLWLAEAVIIGGCGILSDKVVQMTVYDAMAELDSTIKEIRQLTTAS